VTGVTNRHEKFAILPVRVKRNMAHWLCRLVVVRPSINRQKCLVFFTGANPF